MNVRYAPRRLSLSCALLALTLWPACGTTDMRPPGGTASDQWARSYPLAAGGEFQIVGGEGWVEIRGGDGTEIQVTAERVVKAGTEASAREIVSRVKIREDITPEKVVLQSIGLEGIIIGVEQRINYRVTVPRTARVRVRTNGGAISVSDVEGGSVLSSANGEVTGKNLKGPVEARAVNNKVNIDLAAFAGDPVDVRTTNGAATLSIPASIDATLTATSVNGTITLEELKGEPLGEQTRRRQRVKLNAGGPPIEVGATNGSVRVVLRP